MNVKLSGGQSDMLELIMVILVVVAHVVVLMFLCRWIFRIDAIVEQLEGIRQLLEVISKK